jgi:lysophospholipase L1-like esterase
MRLAQLLLILITAGALAAAEGPRPTIPVEKDRPRHDQFLAVAKAGGIDLLFIGDSITDNWRSAGKTVWDKFFAPLKAANFGIGGDRTEHVLWRLRNGELDGIHPRAVVLMIGTNNPDPAEDVAQGVKAILAEIQSRLPGTRILLLGIFPRGEKPGNARAKNEQASALIAKFANPSDPKRIVYMDIGARFLAADGTLPADIMPDFLHPNAKGYQIWAEAIIDTVKQLMQEDPGHLAPTFATPSAAPRVAKVEATIAAGNVVTGCKALERLAADKDADTAAAATASLAAVAAWKDGLDAELARLHDLGDLYAAAELAGGLGKVYSGESGKAYRDQASELRKDPAYAVGRDFQKLLTVPYGSRKDPRFAKQVEAFTKKHPDGYYAEQAKALVIQ